MLQILIFIHNILELWCAFQIYSASQFGLPKFQRLRNIVWKHYSVWTFAVRNTCREITNAKTSL